jgi:hypothetical protein
MQEFHLCTTVLPVMGREKKLQLLHAVSFKNTQHPLPTNIEGKTTCLCFIPVFLFRAVKKVYWFSHPKPGCHLPNSPWENH